MSSPSEWNTMNNCHSNSWCISDSDSDPHPYDDGHLVLPRMELRNGLFQSEEKIEEVEHVISVFIWNLGNAPMHNVRWRATVAECANSNWFWDKDQRNIGTLAPRESLRRRRPARGQAHGRAPSGRRACRPRPSHSDTPGIHRP